MLSGQGWWRDALRAMAGPLICATVLTGLLTGWAVIGGAGALTRTRLEVTTGRGADASLHPRAAGAVHAATTYLTITNITGTADELVAVSSPIARRAVLTRRRGPAYPRTAVAALAIPAHGTLSLNPFVDDVVLQQPVPYENDTTVPVTLTFRHAGSVTIDAFVTAPGTP